MQQHRDVDRVKVAAREHVRPWPTANIQLCRLENVGKIGGCLEDLIPHGGCDDAVARPLRTLRRLHSTRSRWAILRRPPGAVRESAAEERGLCAVASADFEDAAGVRGGGEGWVLR